jgi:hypothetical protein
MMQTHILNTPKRRFTVHVHELADRVAVAVQCSQYGILGDEYTFSNWLLPIVSKYESDPRPIVMDNVVSGERAQIQDQLAILEGPE